MVMNMADIVTIKCPKCGAVIKVKNVPGIESKSVKCPSCKEINPFIKFKRPSDISYENSGGEEPTHYGNEEPTMPNLNVNTVLGVLTLPSGKMVELKVGRNVIGRAATTSQATIQLPTDPAHKRLSREHIVIEVVKDSTMGYVHYASLYKKEVNTTKINSAVLEYGDKIKLADGDKIYLPDMVLTFELPDEEKTSLS